MTTFIASGKLGNIPSGIWEKGSTRFVYLDVGDQRIDSVSVNVYLDASLLECVGEYVELSFCRLGNGGIHLAAIKTENGTIHRLPDPKGTLISETIVGAFVFGVVTLVTTAMGGPILFGAALYPFRSLLSGTDSRIFEPVMFLLFFGLWMTQLIWVLFYSKRISPRMRIRVINKARSAFD